jgi:hypothetical protein
VNGQRFSLKGWLPLLHAELMFDFPDDNRASYEPATWERIVKLKAAHDPLNLFRDLNFARPGASTASSK